VSRLAHSLALAFGLTAMACGHTTPDVPRAADGTLNSTSNVALGPGDVFEVRVFAEPDLSGAFRVASDGSIDFPLVGKFQVEGLTASKLSDKLTEELARFLQKPNVSVFVKEFNSKKVFVLGEVQRPGTFPFEDGMNIIQAVTLAGGFTRLADQNGTYVTRILDEKEHRLKVPVKAIGEGSATNFDLQPGDIVFVPESIF
jgi:protein involved in polysaccharide export with SLBB domain